MDKCIKSLSKKTKTNGYQFWVIGNRTVKKILLPTNKIIVELAKKYNLICLANYYRKISNKVMPSLNSPTNNVGDKIQTMMGETIIFFKKID